MYVEVCLLSSASGVEKILIDYSRTHTLQNVLFQRVGLLIHPLLLCSDEIILSPVTFVSQLEGDECFFSSFDRRCQPWLSPTAKHLRFWIWRVGFPRKTALRYIV